MGTLCDVAQPHANGNTPSIYSTHVRSPIVSFVSVQLVLCKLSGGTFKSCVSQRLKLTIGGVQVWTEIAGLAPVGTRLLFGLTGYVVAASCSWNPQNLTVSQADCEFSGGLIAGTDSSVPTNYIGTRYTTDMRSIVLDAANNIAYFISPAVVFNKDMRQGGVWYCKLPLQLAECSLPMNFTAAGAGAISGGYLYITMGMPGYGSTTSDWIAKCPLTADGISKASCTYMVLTVSNPPSGAMAPYSPIGIHIVGNTALVSVQFFRKVDGASSPVQDNHHMAACDINTFVCTLSNGDGMFKAPASVGMDIYGGTLYVPNILSGSITTCTNPTTLTGCSSFWVDYRDSNGKMQVLEGANDLAFV